MKHAWNWIRNERSGIARSVPLLLLIAVAAVISYRYHVLLRSQRDMVEHTYRVITRLESTLVGMVDAETGQRGYIITGNEAYLAPYSSAVADTPDELAQLRGLVKDSPSQLQRVQLLDQRIGAKLAELQQTIELRRTAGADAARSRVLRDDGRAEMDAVRDIIAAMRAAERDLLAQRSAKAKATERALVMVTVVCTLLSILARIGLAVVWARRAKRQTA
jgi:methyl-accepting chemotaxis protein